ncbi:hypothetical protein G7Y79_00025g057050 [Physcia stellaris]|nr:hypothetical protein G7Y79_00025g057050 [Physcia stellaris]
MAASNKKVYNVAVLLYTGTDILDFAGPIEMLSHTLYNTDIEHPEPVFKPTLIARCVCALLLTVSPCLHRYPTVGYSASKPSDPFASPKTFLPTPPSGILLLPFPSPQPKKPTNMLDPPTSGPEILAGNVMTVKADMSIATALPKISDFDILVVPGGWPTLLLNMINSGSEELKFIEAFNASSAPNNDHGKGDEKIILSICTGALFLAATGVLAGLKATTHHMSLDLLRATDPSIEVLSSGTEGEKPRRYVDGGVNAQGKRVVTAGASPVAWMPRCISAR